MKRNLKKVRRYAEQYAYMDARWLLVRVFSDEFEKYQFAQLKKGKTKAEAHKLAENMVVNRHGLAYRAAYRVLVNANKRLPE